MCKTLECRCIASTCVPGLFCCIFCVRATINDGHERPELELMHLQAWFSPLLEVAAMLSAFVTVFLQFGCRKPLSHGACRLP